MQRMQILLELEQLKALTEIARREKRSLSDVVREMLDKELQARKKQELAAAAQALMADYQGDPELTAFMVLDARISMRKEEGHG
jgi:metal-responsive CopG/Arc/MetJ family transcriptional regulator